MKVLYIGGDGDIAYMTGRILERRGCDVTVAVGMVQALEQLQNTAFDLAVADCDMGADELFGIISASGAERPPKLLVISGDRDDEVPLLKAGADDWVQKPYKMDVLLARMDTLLRRDK